MKLINRLRNVARLTMVWPIGMALGLCPGFSWAGTVDHADDMTMKNLPWDNIIRIAKEYVRAESPENVWPFLRAKRSLLLASKRKVFIHYFPPYPISIDNEPPDADYWSSQYLRRSGEGGKYAERGGFARQRPLPRPPWRYSYWREIDATIDVLRAGDMGADGFGVDILQMRAGRYWDQARRICAAASALGGDFKFVPEVDTAVLAAATEGEIADVISILNACPAAYRLADGRMLVVPFAPETRSVEFWKHVLKILDRAGTKIAFVPDMLNLQKGTDPLSVISAGMSFWGAKDVGDAASQSTLAAERHAATAAAFWMQPVAIQDVRPSGSVFWESRNTLLLRTLWRQAIDERSEYAHLVTWNDYGEGTEFEPSSGSGFVYYDLSAYYIQWYKLGKPPKPIADAIYYTHRTQLLAPDVPTQNGDIPFGHPGMTPVSNNVEVVALLMKPANIEIEQNGHIAKKTLSGGLQTFSTDAEIGTPLFRITRDNIKVIEIKSRWLINGQPERANPDYFGGSSTRPN